jgi:hypothetical protein
MAKVKANGFKGKSNVSPLWISSNQFLSGYKFSQSGDFTILLSSNQIVDVGSSISHMFLLFGSRLITFFAVGNSAS